MTKATISDTIKTLEQKNLVVREPEQHDSRSYIINLTDTGREIAGKTSLFSKEIGVPVANLHPTEKEKLLLNLLDIIRHLNKTGIITIQRMCVTCRFYQTSETNEHFCTLLNQKLHDTDLRVDCPEHVLKVE